jgi:hypothetical protein
MTYWLNTQLFFQISAILPFAPDTKFRKIHGSPNVDEHKLATDVSGFPNDNFPACSKTNFSKILGFIEFKFKLEHVSSNNSATGNKSFERKSEQHLKHQYRGQIAAYTAAIAGSRFRVYVFSLSVGREDQDFLKIMVLDVHSFGIETEKVFIVSFPPLYWTHSPFSRATRSMPAFYLGDQRTCVYEGLLEAKRR